MTILVCISIYLGLDLSTAPVCCQGCILLPDATPASSASDSSARKLPQRIIELNDGDIIAIDWSYAAIQEVCMYRYLC